MTREIEVQQPKDIAEVVADRSRSDMELDDFKPVPITVSTFIEASDAVLTKLEEEKKRLSSARTENESDTDTRASVAPPYEDYTQDHETVPPQRTASEFAPLPCSPPLSEDDAQPSEFCPDAHDSNANLPEDTTSPVITVSSGDEMTEMDVPDKQVSRQRKVAIRLYTDIYKYAEFEWPSSKISSKPRQTSICDKSRATSQPSWQDHYMNFRVPRNTPFAIERTRRIAELEKQEAAELHTQNNTNDMNKQEAHLHTHAPSKQLTIPSPIEKSAPTPTPNPQLTHLQTRLQTLESSLRTQRNEYRILLSRTWAVESKNAHLCALREREAAWHKHQAAEQEGVLRGLNERIAWLQAELGAEEARRGMAGMGMGEVGYGQKGWRYPPAVVRNCSVGGGMRGVN